MTPDIIDTIFGKFTASSKHRLDLTFDYESCAIRSFKSIVAHLQATHVIDVGANIGVYSVYVSGLPSVTCVHAFEPAPEALEILEANAALQPEGKIECHGLALSSQNDVVQFSVVSPMAGNNAIASTASRTGNLIEVQARRLDDVLNLSNRRLCLKIDVEGHECETLKGAQRLLQSNTCFLQIESLKASTMAELLSIARAYGLVHLFTLQNDHLFISESLADQRETLTDILFANLALDLRDLTQLRMEKRKLATDARKLYRAIGYTKDPVLEHNP